MKKREKISLIHKLAYEYAESGKCKDYQSIEYKIRFDDNLPEARRVLDDRFIRDELNKLCSTATSEIETKRRNEFNLFIYKIQKINFFLFIFFWYFYYILHKTIISRK